MDFDNRKVYGDTSITDGLVYLLTASLLDKKSAVALLVLQKKFVQSKTAAIQFWL